MIHLGRRKSVSTHKLVKSYGVNPPLIVIISEVFKQRKLDVRVLWETPGNLPDHYLLVDKLKIKNEGK